MKRVWDGILLGFVGIFVVLGIYFSSYDLIMQSHVEPSRFESSTASVMEVSNTVQKEENVVVEDVEKVEEVEEVYEEPSFVQTELTQEYSAPQEEVSGNRIRIGGVLDLPLMTDSGDNFYLNHNIYGQYDGLGVPYKDYRTDFNTRKTIIYAHSSTMGNGPFQALQNYHNNKWFYDNNRYITVNFDGNTYTYEIFSVYVSLAEDANSEGLEYFYVMNYSDSSWGDRIQWYKDNSEYDTGVSVSSSDKILILQTCSMDPNYYEQYYRYNLLVMGKLI